MQLESDDNFLDALNQTTPQRIMIMGRPGSGKSTFSIKLQSMLNIPLYHLDKHFFEANWIQGNYQDFLNQQQYFVSQSSWIIDGNSSKSLELRYSRADICLYFNFPRYLCCYRSGCFISILLLTIVRQGAKKLCAGRCWNICGAIKSA